MAITTLLFISTAVIFWAPNFAENVLKGDKGEVLTVFVVVCVTGPVLGIIIGGAVVQKFAGGYEGKHASSFGVLFAGLALLCALPIRQISNIYSFGLCLWAVLFFGGGVIPNIQGIMISSLSTDLRASGNSLSNIMQNAFGFLPAPFVYGIIYKYSKNYDQKLAFAITLWYSGVGVILLCFSLYYRFKKFSATCLTETLTSEIEVNNTNKNSNKQENNIDNNNVNNEFMRNNKKQLPNGEITCKGNLTEVISNEPNGSFITEKGAKGDVNYKNNDSINNMSISLNNQKKKEMNFEMMNLREKEIVAK